MSQGRSVWRELFKNMVNSVKIGPPKGRLVGEDHLGNKYFQVVDANFILDASSLTYGHRTSRKYPIRWFEPLKENDWQQNLPAEWEAWLRNRRKEPPTVEEVVRNLAMAQMKKEKAAELEKKADEERGYPLPETKPVLKGFPKLESHEREPGEHSDEKIK